MFSSSLQCHMIRINYNMYFFIITTINIYIYIYMYCTFDQMNTAFLSLRDFFQNKEKSYPPQLFQH